MNYIVCLMFYLEHMWVERLTVSVPTPTTAEEGASRVYTSRRTGTGAHLIASQTHRRNKTPKAKAKPKIDEAPPTPERSCAVDHATLPCDLSTDHPISAHAKASPHVLQGKPAHIPAVTGVNCPTRKWVRGTTGTIRLDFSAVKMRGPTAQKSK